MQFFRFVVVNNSGQTLTFNNNGRINIKLTGWTYDTSTGKKTYTQLADDDMGFTAGSSLADGAEIITGTEQTNVATGYIGYEVQLEITHDEGTAADGTFDVKIARGDATGELPTDASGYASAEANKLDPVLSLTWESNGLDDEVMRSNVRDI